jgi:hypothetical protein
MNALILGKNIELPVLLGIVERNKEEEVSVIFCTPSQQSLLIRMGLASEVNWQLMANLEHLNEWIKEREIKEIAERIKSFNSDQVFLAGEVNQAWVIAAVKSGKFLRQWDKASPANLDSLCVFAQMTKKDVPQKKQIGGDEQFFLWNFNKCNVARFFPKSKIAVVQAMNFPFAMNFLALGLKERLIQRVLVVCKEEAPGFVEEWARCLPSTLASGGGFGSITLGESGFEETWTREVFSRIQVISTDELNTVLGVAA